MNFFLEFDLEVVFKNSCFHSWIVIFKDFCINLSSNERAIFSEYDSSMIIWSRLTDYSINIETSIISVLSVAFFKPFLTITLKNVTSQLILENIEGIERQISYIKNLSSDLYTSIMPDLQEKYFEVMALYDSTQNREFHAKIAWLVIVASGLSNISNLSLEDIIIFDKPMFQLLIELINKIEAKDPSLDLAILLYLINFRHPNLHYEIEQEMSMEDIYSKIGNPKETKKKLYKVVFEVVYKNLNSSSHPLVLKYSLKLFENFGRWKDFYNMNLIQKFMTDYPNYRLCDYDPYVRSRFFKVLTSMWLSKVSKKYGKILSHQLDSFLFPLSESIKASIVLKNPKIFELIFRELKGICSQLIREGYCLEFYEWFITRTDILQIVRNEFQSEEKLMSALLKFLNVFTKFRKYRNTIVNFLAKGIVLFKKVSEVLVPYGNFLADSANVLPNILSKIRRVTEILFNLMSCDYVCLEIFEVYNDNCFIQALLMNFRLISVLTHSEITVFPIYTDIKPLKALHDFFFMICESHLDIVFSHIPLDLIQKFVLHLKHGIITKFIIDQRNNRSTLNYSLNSISSFSQYIFKTLKNNTQGSGKIKEIFLKINPIFTEILEIIIGLVIQQHESLNYVLTPALFRLILIHKNLYKKIVKAEVIKAIKNTEYQEKFVEQFLHLMVGVPRNIERESVLIFNENFRELNQTIGSFTKLIFNPIKTVDI